MCHLHHRQNSVWRWKLIYLRRLHGRIMCSPVPKNGWTCDACTLINRSKLLNCLSCGKVHPSKEDKLVSTGKRLDPVITIANGFVDFELGIDRRGATASDCGIWGTNQVDGLSSSLLMEPKADTLGYVSLFSFCRNSNEIIHWYVLKTKISKKICLMYVDRTWEVFL